jgi:hypothetical protein
MGSHADRAARISGAAIIFWQVESALLRDGRVATLIAQTV